ncbi:hypothetical protein [Chryseobacterium kwangjuense]|uniref:Uncharacterized protein n=1 Tax=Chryseobacterium kwangjuense TaxID=267125 RepID=A0A135W444_9FLAO|nr:hypothetical protein [Chryseobacterium kwangjuense]KXH79704.1 hypothetical protein AU378_20300 [Chryseobacterium kwangjuense]
MYSNLKYEQFLLLEAGDKVDFLDYFIAESYYGSYQRIELKQFLQNIILGNENAYLKQKALEIYSAMVQMKVLIASSFLGTLVEDIADDVDPFILITRLKLLYIHFDESKESENVFEKLAYHLNADVASEARYRRGLLRFTTIPLKDDNSYLSAILEAQEYFKSSFTIVENRIDADYFFCICELLSALIANESNEYLSLKNNCIQKLWRLNLFAEKDDFTLEYQIGNALGIIIDMATKIGAESTWTDYRRSFSEIFELHQKLMSLEVKKGFAELSIINNISNHLRTNIISPLYKLNFSVCSAKIQVLIDGESDNEFKTFLEEILKSLEYTTIKKNADHSLVATLARKYKSIPIQQIKEDVAILSNEPSELAVLVGQYADQDQKFYLTGYPQGEEIFRTLNSEITKFLPSYPPQKLQSFAIVLSNLITYVVRTMQDKKEFFPELYDPTLVKGRTEHVFQESLYRNLRQGNVGYRYLYEPNQSGGGRIDVTYNEDTFIFPIEVKKTSKLPTWENVVKDYIAQAQTYVNAYDQLGIFVVFDLSKKNVDNRPINDIRDLFSLQSLDGLYNLGDNLPNGVVCIIVPANKVSPSSMSNYR